MFGGAAYVYNVIDVRQSYLQKLLKQALIAVGHPEGAERSHHFSYEMVALSHATARELGLRAASRLRGRQASVRRGLGPQGARRQGRRSARHADSHPPAPRSARATPSSAPRTGSAIAQMIAIAAVRYFMIKFSRGKVIAFDLEEALSFEGESGPYIQYAVVRANNIFQKLQQRDGLDEAALLTALRDVPTGELDGANGSHELWSLVLDASRLDEVVEQVIRSLEFSVLAKYAFTLAQAFNAFYHRAPILNEERDDVRRWRAAAVIYLRNQLRTALDLMGVAVPPTDVDAKGARGARRRCRSSRLLRAASCPTTKSRCAAPAATSACSIRATARGRRRRSRGVDGLLLTGGGDVLPVNLRRHGASDVRRGGAWTRRVRDRARAPRDRSRPSTLGHLPRHSAAERRARRHAHPAHPRRSRDDGQPPGADAAAFDRA